MMIGIVLMLIIASVTLIKCNTAIDQTGLNTLSVSKQTAHPSENRPNSGSRGTRDTTRIKQPKIMLSHALDHSTYSLSHLADLCPYADICDQQGRKTPSKSRASCCLPCSCDSTCRKIGNCCDKRENTGFMCYSPKLKQSGSPQTAESGYFMVDTCLDESEIDCKAENSAAWGSFYPVYDPDLELIFYNPKCAECSGAKDYTSWGLNVVCQGTNINDAYFLDVLRGKLSEKCFIKFMPPKQMIEMNHICFSGLISRCNATGLWETYNPVLEEACTRFYSPVVNNLFGMVRYSNIYCQQCNGGLPTNPEDLCTPPKLEKTTIGASLALTIDYRQISSLVDKRIANVLKPNTDGGCREGTVKHISIEKPECRTTLCPNGFIRSRKKCVPLSLKSPNDGYNIQLLLTPTSDKLLPLSYLETLTKDQKLEPITWFDSRGVPLDYFDLMVKRVIIEHTVFVDSFIVRIGKNQDPVNLSNEIKFLQDVMNKPWFITLNNTVFEFTVKFYRYASFVPLMTYWWYNVLIEVTSNMTRESVRSVQEEEAFEIVQMKTTHQPGLKPFTLKKTNFCNRVRLDRSEWLAGFQEIRLNTSEAVLDSNKTLGDSEFDIFLGEQGEPTVEICVEDFNPNYHEQVARGMANVLFSNWLPIFIQSALFVLKLF